MPNQSLGQYEVSYAKAASCPPLMSEMAVAPMDNPKKNRSCGRWSGFAAALVENSHTDAHTRNAHRPTSPKYQHTPVHCNPRVTSECQSPSFVRDAQLVRRFVGRAGRDRSDALGPNGLG